MGVDIFQMWAHCHLKSYDQTEPYEALQKLLASGHWKWGNADSKLAEISKAFEQTNSLGELLRRVGFDYNSYHLSINFCHEGYSDSGWYLKVLQSIAPWIKKGSFIMMRNENGSNWCWYFNGKTCEDVWFTIEFNHEGMDTRWAEYYL